MRVIEIKGGRVTQVKNVLNHYILREGEMLSANGEKGQTYDSETGKFSDYVPTQEEINAERIAEITLEIQLINKDIELYSFDTDKVAELENQRQLLIDEYNTLK